MPHTSRLNRVRVENIHTIEIRIYYEDTDCGGVVYYANYLKYFERARTSHLESVGIDLKHLQFAEEKRFFVVTSAQVDYHAPAHYGDILLVESTIEEVRGASLNFVHKVTGKAGGRKLVTGRVKLASVGHDGRILRFSPDMAEQLKEGRNYSGR